MLERNSFFAVLKAKTGNRSRAKAARSRQRSPWKLIFVLFIAPNFSAPIPAASADPFAGAVNHGLVGVGRISAAAFDAGRKDTLSGFSALTVDRRSVTNRAGAITGRLFGLSDRGYGDGSRDYRPRLQVFDFRLQPVLYSHSQSQNQLQLTSVASIPFTDAAGAFFTGFDAGDSSEQRFPKSSLASLGGGRPSLDAEGLALQADGSIWVADEYGPFIYLFDPQGKLRETLRPSDAFIPRIGGRASFTAEVDPVSGRRANRGFEGLTLVPSGKKLVAILQSPLMQDGGSSDVARHTRLVMFDAAEGSPKRGKATAGHVFQLTMNGDRKGSKATLVSEIVAVNETMFLILERDSSGRGGNEDAPFYKRVVLISTDGATNIAGTGYDLAPHDHGAMALPISALPRSVTPVRRTDLINILDRGQLQRFRITAEKNPNKDPQAISEKWEGLALFRASDAAAPDDCILFVSNDNDFKAERVFHNGAQVAKNTTEVDHMILCYRITLPTAGF
jgi:hypothetical protein